MSQISNEDLIQKSNSQIIKGGNNDSITGSVGCALLTEKGNIYTGVCVEMQPEAHICAEQNAISEMKKAGESKINKIVATWKDEKGDFYVVSPCGRCRQAMYDVNSDNLNSDIILNKDSVVKLRALLPHNNEYNKI